MANAFTAGGTTRPIPADFGPSHQGANAFTDSGAEVMAPVPMPPAAVPPGGMAPARAPAPWGAPGAGPGRGPAPYGPVAQVNPVMAVPGPARPAAELAPPTEAANTPRLLALLRESLYPSQREWAADCLAGHDGRREPQVVQGLLAAAREDPAATVRAGCVRSLARLKVNTPPVVAAVRALKDDADALVRQEAEQALAGLEAAPAPRMDSAVRPVRGQ
jgi:hypothetical protein